MTDTTPGAGKLPPFGLPSDTGGKDFGVFLPMANGGWVSMHEDVTESKQREASFRLLFESNPLPMWVCDRETLRFLDVNAAAVEHYNYSREQFLAMTLLDIRPEEDWDDIRASAGPKGNNAAGRIRRLPVRDYLLKQGRFAHFTKDDIDYFQSKIDDMWTKWLIPGVIPFRKDLEGEKPPAA